ncbi:hypothetical protein BO71DRAFT_458575 [Aspergillus ellipticus CBS 707.79]|uniref:Uncharacterized protein n=1 Tax=Aspergillus ellipticus CBS 707.79 TaxID=1448320 RepID=A0A319DV35_9EURO|nr:hypothetical protein BO71DRAFT_458575 [Aspergillus ellipticus CBS 707.79]
MQQSYHHSLETISEEISPLDHEVLCHGDTTSNIERLPSRLQQSKRASTDIRQQLHNLVYEISYLRAELQWQKESKQILLHFHEEIFRLFHLMEDMLVGVTAKLNESEQRYLDVLGIKSHGSQAEGDMI